MVFETKDLTKSFGEKRVLEGVSLRAESGSAVGLLGRNGAGKTTTIRIVMGVFPPDSGEVILDGAPIRHEKLDIGYLPEERGLYPKKIIMEQLLYLAELRGMKRKSARTAALHWLERLEMGEYANKKLDTLSKGNQQKIQLAATLMTNPPFVILDEPFSGLDPVNAMLLKDVVKEMIADGKLVLFSSHQMNYVEEFCDSISILNKGKIVLSGGIKEIKRGYDRKKIVVSARDTEKVARYCREVLAPIVSGTEEHSGELLVTLREQEKKNELLSALVGQGFDLDGVRVHEPSLNDIFVEYTEDGI